VNYTVENTGDVPATQNVTFSVDGTVEDVRTGVMLGGGETVDGGFTYATGAGDTPDVTVSVATADDTAATNVSVLEPAVFAVETVETNGPLVAGTELVVTVSVANVGGATANRTLQVAAGPVGNAERVVALGGNESTEETFAFDSATEQLGLYNVTADVGDDQAVGVVELFPTPLPNGGGPPQDPDTDGLYENVDGDDSFDIFDVQALFNNFERTALKQHTPAYDFSPDGELSIFDVQGLFNELS
jgi:PKD repeat protein